MFDEMRRGRTGRMEAEAAGAEQRTDGGRERVREEVAADIK